MLPRITKEKQLCGTGNIELQVDRGKFRIEKIKWEKFCEV